MDSLPWVSRYSKCFFFCFANLFVSFLPFIFFCLFYSHHSSPISEPENIDTCPLLTYWNMSHTCAALSLLFVCLLTCVCCYCCSRVVLICRWLFCAFASFFHQFKKERKKFQLIIETNITLQAKDSLETFLSWSLGWTEAATQHLVYL